MKYHRRKGHFSRPKDIKRKKRQITKLSRFKKREFRNPYFEKKEPPFIFILLKQYYQYILVFGFLVFLFWGFFISTFFQVQTIDIQGNEFVSTENLNALVEEQVKERKWFVFSQQNMVFFDADSLYQNLSNHYAFDSLKVDKNYRHTIHVIVKERIPGVTYQNGNSIFRIDLDGIATQGISEEERTRQLPHIVDENSRGLSVNDQTISKEWLLGLFYVEENLVSIIPEGDRIYALPEMRCVEIKQMEQEILVPVYTALPEDDDLLLDEEVGVVLSDDVDTSVLDEDEHKIIVETRDVEVEVECDYLATMQDAKVSINDDWFVYFDFSGNLADQLSALALVLRDSIDDVTQVEYVDVRIPSRVFYK